MDLTSMIFHNDQLRHREFSFGGCSPKGLGAFPSEIQDRSPVGEWGRPEAEAVCRHCYYRFWLP